MDFLSKGCLSFVLMKFEMSKHQRCAYLNEAFFLQKDKSDTSGTMYFRYKMFLSLGLGRFLFCTNCEVV